MNDQPITTFRLSNDLYEIGFAQFAQFAPNIFIYF